MRDFPALPQKLRQIERQVEALRKEIRKKPDPSALGRICAAIHVDYIARLASYSDQLELASGYQLFDFEHTFEEGIARANAILRLELMMTEMLVKQFHCFLECYGGSQAIAVQQIVRWASEDPARLDWLAAFAVNKRSRQGS